MAVQMIAYEQLMFKEKESKRKTTEDILIDFLKEREEQLSEDSNELREHISQLRLDISFVDDIIKDVQQEFEVKGLKIERKHVLPLNIPSNVTISETATSKYIDEFVRALAKEFWKRKASEFSSDLRTYRSLLKKNQELYEEFIAKYGDYTHDEMTWISPFPIAVTRFMNLITNRIKELIDKIELTRNAEMGARQSAKDADKIPLPTFNGEQLTLISLFDIRDRNEKIIKEDSSELQKNLDQRQEILAKINELSQKTVVL